MITVITLREKINERATTIEEIEDNIQILGKLLRRALSDQEYNAIEDQLRSWNKKLSKANQESKNL